MRARAILVALVALCIAGCGGAQHAAAPKPPPKLPRALAQTWAQQADDVATAIDAGDGCTALQRAETLQAQVVDAVNAHQVPRRYVEPLVSTANDLAGRIICTPPPVVTTDDGHQGHDKHPKHDKHNKHGNGGD